MTPGRTVSRVALWLLVAGVLIGAFAALWIGTELHYRNCLTEREELARSAAPWAKEFGAIPAGKNCSRLP